LGKDKTVAMYTVVVDTVDVLTETFFDVDKVVVEIFTVDLTNVV
jgi:hypothetical protein